MSTAYSDIKGEDVRAGLVSNFKKILESSSDEKSDPLSFPLKKGIRRDSSAHADGGDKLTRERRASRNFCSSLFGERPSNGFDGWVGVALGVDGEKFEDFFGALA